MDTIQVDGKTALREWVGGKHATFHSMGTRNIVEDEGIFTNTSQAPSLSIVEDSENVKVGIPFQLTANGSAGIVDLIWNVADSDIPELYGTSPSFVFSKAGTYTITCTALFASGDTLTAAKEVTVTNVEAPVAAFDILNDTLPAGNYFSFVNHCEGDGCTYLWSMPGAEVEEFTGTNAVAIYHQVGTYSVTLTASNSFGSSSVTRQVTVCESAPEARFKLSKTEIMIGDTIQLIDESRYSPLSWQWELENGCRVLLTDEQSPFVVPTAPGIYDVSLTAYNELGENTLTRSQHLVVSNDNPGTSLNFTGVESLKIPCPFTEKQSALTLDWWMRSKQYKGCMNLSSSQGKFTTSVDTEGKLTVAIGSRKAISAENFIINNEWHHYAIVYNKGVVDFYRDAVHFGTASTKLTTTFPILETITMGIDPYGFKGQIDEVRVWGSALSKAKITKYSNQHISDIQAAQADDALLLYYDFNQSGGDVIDRTGSAFHAQRIGFGPDGDAWNSSLGVFTLDNMALMHGDISADYLTNYKNPFIKGSGTVNPASSSRFLRLAMGTSSSTWQDANAIVNGSIITGAHIDTSHKSDITFETVWSNFAAQLFDYRLWQTVKLPAGKYTFSVTFGDGNDAMGSRLVVCKGDSMVSDAECEEKAIAWCKLIDGSLTFTLDSETKVSLGIIVNLPKQASFSISAFKLEGATYERLTPVNYTDITDIYQSQPGVHRIYNIFGQPLKEIQKGINIIDGKKILNR
jgi:PKD repeat protein